MTVGDGPFRTPSPPRKSPAALEEYPRDGKLTVVGIHDVGSGSGTGIDRIVDVVHHALPRPWFYLWLIKGRPLRRVTYYNKRTLTMGGYRHDVFFDLHGHASLTLAANINKSITTYTHRCYLLGVASARRLSGRTTCDD